MNGSVRAPGRQAAFGFIFAAAVMNAVNDALRRAYGVAHIDMPATPLAIFNAIAAAGAPKS